MDAVKIDIEEKKEKIDDEQINEKQDDMDTIKIDKEENPDNDQINKNQDDNTNIIKIDIENPDNVRVNENQANNQANIHQNSDMMFPIIIGIWRMSILVTFITVDFYYGLTFYSDCDKNLCIFLLVDGLFCCLRMITCFVATISPKIMNNWLIFFIGEKIVYNVIVIGWCVSGICYGISNIFCHRDGYSSIFILYWVSISMTFVYRIMDWLPLIIIYNMNINVNRENVMDFIKSLDVLSFSNGSLVDVKGNVVKKLEKDDDKCMICLGDYTPSEKIVRLPCGHHFHEECNKEWLTTNPKCPYCNKYVVEGCIYCIEYAEGNCPYCNGLIKN